MRHARFLTGAVVVAAGLLTLRAAPRLIHKARAASVGETVTAPDAGPPVRRRTRPRPGGMDLTFLVTADTHAGYSEKIAIPGAPSGVGIERSTRSSSLP